ncbi:MAG: HNH endonuclease [Candidatus Thorarchaeota archaeon]|nr:MAG: HNH endonuclease [Candidatus Thorarchaeota archaeon]
MPKPRTFTLEDFRRAVKTNNTVRQILIQLKLSSQGGNYKTVYRFAKQNDIELSHLMGKHARKGKPRPLKRPLLDYLSNKAPIKSFVLKKRLLREKVFEHQCSCCHISTWLDQPAPLELDHINGNSDDNTLNNLRLLCPNCHAQTPTYRGKNIRKRK